MQRQNLIDKLILFYYVMTKFDIQINFVILIVNDDFLIVK
jgi:hypothetical protein